MLQVDEFLMRIRHIADALLEAGALFSRGEKSQRDAQEEPDVGRHAGRC